MDHPKNDSPPLVTHSSELQARLSGLNYYLVSAKDPSSSASLFHMGVPQSAHSHELQNQLNPSNGAPAELSGSNHQANFHQNSGGDWSRQIHHTNPDFLAYGKPFPSGQFHNMYLPDAGHLGFGLLQPVQASMTFPMSIQQYAPQHHHPLHHHLQLSGVGPQKIIPSIGFVNAYGAFPQVTQPPHIQQVPQINSVPVPGSVFYVPRPHTVPQIKIPEFSHQPTPSGSLSAMDIQFESRINTSGAYVMSGVDSKAETPLISSLASAATHSSPSSSAKIVHESHSPKQQTIFLPTLTKQNSNPKINKIVSDRYDSRLLTLQDSSIKLEETSLDAIFLHFRKVLGVYNYRVEIEGHYEYALQNDLEKELFDLFARRVSPFIDLFLPMEIFQKIVCEVSLYDETRMIFDSIMCLSSLIYQRMYPTRMDPLTPLKYYQKSVNTIRHNLNLMEFENRPLGLLARCLLSTNFLCIYELFFVAVDSTYIKRVGSMLISILSKHSKSLSLLKLSPFYSSCFWTGFVCDIILSLKLESPCVYCPDRVWAVLDPLYFKQYDDYAPYLETSEALSADECSMSLGSRKNTTWWLHKILLIFSRVIIFANLMEVITYEDYCQNKDLEVWKKLKCSLDEYENNMPLYIKPLFRQAPDDNMQFPTIYFKDEQSATIGINFILTGLYLRTALTRKVRVADETLLRPELAKYTPDFEDLQARDVAGIMQTYEGNLKLWPVNIHALRQASKHFESGSKAHDALKKLTARVVDLCQTRLSISTIV